MAGLTSDQYISNYTGYMKPTYQNDYNTRLNQLTQQYQTGRQGLEQGRGTVESDYSSGLNKLNELRNTTNTDYASAINKPDVQAAQNTNRLRELMAQRGLLRGGSAVSQEAGIYNQAGQQKNDLYGSRANALSSIGNRQGELEQNRASQLGNLQGQLNLYDQQYGTNKQGLSDQLANQLTSMYSQAPLLAQDYLAKQQSQQLDAMKFAQAALLDIAGKTGQYNNPNGYLPGDILTNLYKNLYSY